MGFSFRSKSLFSVTAYVGSEFLCLPFIILGYASHPLLWIFEVSFFNIDI